MLFFAAVDPQLLRDAGPRIFDNLSREEDTPGIFLPVGARRVRRGAQCVHGPQRRRGDGRSATDRDLP